MSYSGNYVSEHPHKGNDESCTGFNPEDFYDSEQPAICFICGELIEIGGGKEFLDETICADCFKDNTVDELEKQIKKLKL